MTTSEPARTKRSARDERRQQLLQAARQVFSSNGYHDATVDDITRAAGVAKGTFYLYFTEKRAILHELVQYFFGMVTEVGLSVTQDISSPREFFQRLEDASQRLAVIFRENRDLVRLAYRESMSADPELEGSVRDFYRRFAQVEADNVRRGIALGLFRDDLNPLIAAYAHIGMVERVLLESLFDRTFPAEPNLVPQLLQLAYRGLLREPRAGAEPGGAG
jgi:AcrR family transcriptional regulator